MLCSNGLFGDNSLPLKKLLETAYTDFKDWCKVEGVSCSQPVFTPGLVACKIWPSDSYRVLSKRNPRFALDVGCLISKVLKKTGDVLFTGKAYNNRVVCEWLACRLRNVMDAGGYFDERLPLAARAMQLD